MTVRFPQAETYVIATDEKTGVIECRRCGVRKTYTLPMTIAAWVKMTRQFNKDHAKCPPRPDTVS